jgi:hypothetical protein
MDRGLMYGNVTRRMRTIRRSSRRLHARLLRGRCMERVTTIPEPNHTTAMLMDVDI